MGPASSQDPSSAGLSSFPNWEALHSVHTLTHTGLALAQRLGMVLWVPGPGLSILSLLPLISWGDLRPKAVGTWVRGAKGTAMGQSGNSHAGWEINTKRLESLAALLPLGGMGRVPAGKCGRANRPAGGKY